MKKCHFLRLTAWNKFLCLYLCYIYLVLHSLARCPLQIYVRRKCRILQLWEQLAFSAHSRKQDFTICVYDIYFMYLCMFVFVHLCILVFVHLCICICANAENCSFGSNLPTQPTAGNYSSCAREMRTDNVHVSHNLN